MVVAQTPASVVNRQAELKALIQKHGASLQAQLHQHHRNIFPPEAEKTIRNFSPAEISQLLGIAEGYLRQMAADQVQPGTAKGDAALIPLPTLPRSASSSTRGPGETAGICRTAGQARSFRSSR